MDEGCRIYTLPSDASIPEEGRSVALGFFDGVHIGHRAGLEAACRAGNGRCAAVTFLPHTLTTKPEQTVLEDFEVQTAVMRQCGVAEIFLTDFAAVRGLTPEQFVNNILADQLHATAVTCGFNYRFGRGGSGDAALLRRLCETRGIAVTVVEPVLCDGEPVSSSAIRGLLAHGDMEMVRRMLGRPYCLCYPVIAGAHLGTSLGAPTANQMPPADRMLPRFGVYASAVTIGGKNYAGVTNIGIKPTVGGQQPLAETYIDGFSGDLYGQTIAVCPVRFLREERRFDSLAALQQQIDRDIAQIR